MAHPPFVPTGVTLAPFTPARRRGPSRRVMLGGAAALVVAAAIVLVALARGDGDTDPAALPTTVTAPSANTSNEATTSAQTGSVFDTITATTTTPGPPLDPSGAAIATTSLDGFEAACRSLGLAGGERFCRCARDGLPGNVLAVEIDQATSYFGGQSDVLPPAVRAAMERCTTN